MSICFFTQGDIVATASGVLGVVRFKDAGISIAMTPDAIDASIIALQSVRDQLVASPQQITVDIHQAAP